MVRSSQPPILSLGAEAVMLGLSVGKGAIEPQSERVKRYSPVIRVIQKPMYYSLQQAIMHKRNGELVQVLSGSKSVARLT